MDTLTHLETMLKRLRELNWNIEDHEGWKARATAEVLWLDLKPEDREAARGQGAIPMKTILGISAWFAMSLLLWAAIVWLSFLV